MMKQAHTGCNQAHTHQHHYEREHRIRLSRERHSQLCMSDCVPSEAPPAGGMEVLINTLFLMSNFMGLMFSELAPVCVGVGGVI